MNASGFLDNLSRKLGYSDYGGYLLGSHWKEFSSKVRGNSCVCCNRTGLRLHVHHVTYENFGNELPSDVVTVCERCHKAIHRLVDHNKIPLSEAHSELWMMRKTGCLKKADKRYRKSPFGEPCTKEKATAGPWYGKRRPRKRRSYKHPGR